MAKKWKHRIRVGFYPNTLYHKLFVAKSFLEQKSQSDFGLAVFKEYFDRRGKSEIAHLLSVFEKMTDEEKRNTRKRPN